MEEKWYQKSCFRSLVDMHISNGDERLLASFDAEAYADNMATAGFDTAYIYGSNCLGLCLFPSKTGYRHQITDRRDIFGETVEACRRRGIRAVGYLNHWSTKAYDLHPDWRVVESDGSGSRDQTGHDGRYGVCCMNSPYRDYFLSLVKELCGTYLVEGLWVDMVGFWRRACHCASCRQAFREETGLEIPEREDWESFPWRRYVKFKEDSMARYARDIKKAAQEARPGISVSIQCAGWAMGHHIGFSTAFFGQMDYSAGDFYTDVREQAVDCKFLRGITSNQPFEYMVPRCPDLGHHTVSKPMWQIRQQAYAAFLHGGAFLCIDAIDPAGTLNPAVYRMFGEVRKELEPYWGHPSFLRGEYLNDAAVYVNYQSMTGYDDFAQNGGEGRREPASLPGRLKAMNRTLAEHHIQYDIITDMSLGRLEKYPLIILSGLPVLSQREAEAFREYVRNGGALYVSGQSGVLLDLADAEESESLKRDGFALEDILGVSRQEIIPFQTVYIKGCGATALFPVESLQYPLGAAGPIPEIRAQGDTEVLARAWLPVSNHTDGRHYISAISDPPWQETDIPVLTEHRYGRGKCVYSAALLESEDTQMGRELWTGILERLLQGRRQVRIEAPPCVEASVKQVDGTLCVSLLHTLAHETGSPAGEARVRIRDSFLKVDRAECFPHGLIALEREGRDTVVRGAQLPEFSIITIYSEKQ